MPAPPYAQISADRTPQQLRDARVWPRIIIGFFVIVFTCYAFFLYTAFSNVDPVVESYEARPQ